MKKLLQKTTALAKRINFALQLKYYSTKTNIEFNENNQLLIWLPSIIFDGTRDNKVNRTANHSFHKVLEDILNNLSSENSNKFKYKLIKRLLTRD